MQPDQVPAPGPSLAQRAYEQWCQAANELAPRGYDQDYASWGELHTETQAAWENVIEFIIEEACPEGSR